MKQQRIYFTSDMAASPSAVCPPAPSSSAVCPPAPSSSAVCPPAPSSSATSPSAATSGVFVVTHVIPAVPTAAPQNQLDEVWFSRGRLEALGTVQILIGLVVFLFGIIQLPHGRPLETISGVFVWGALTFITAGSVTVAARRSFNRRLQVKRVLGFSVVAAVTSAAATVIYCVNAIISTSHGYYQHPCSYYGYYNCDPWNYYWVPSVRISCVLAVFSFLELMVSTCIAVFGCRVLCHSTDQPPIIVINQSLKAASQTPVATPTYEDPPIPEAPPPPEHGYERRKLPEYDTIVV